jgi:Na+/melibiose symporter-like transporter
MVNNKKTELASSLCKYLFVSLSLIVIFILMLILSIFTDKPIFQTLTMIVLTLIAIHFSSYIIYFFLIKKYDVSDIFDVLNSRMKPPPSVEILKKRDYISLILMILLIIIFLS